MKKAGRLYMFALGMCVESCLKRNLSADGYAVVTLVTLVAFPIILWREWKSAGDAEGSR